MWGWGLIDNGLVAVSQHCKPGGGFDPAAGAAPVSPQPFTDHSPPFVVPSRRRLEQ